MSPDVTFLRQLSESDPRMYKKDTASWPSGVDPTNARLSQHSTINELHSPHEQTGKGKAYRHLQQCRKGSSPNPTPTPDKSSQKTE